MDFQNRAGSKPGAGGIASAHEQAQHRQERLRRLGMETASVDTDPFVFRNQLGSYECRLCLTVHANEGSYVSHTQGKKHQNNVARRAAREAAKTAGPSTATANGPSAATATATRIVPIRRNFVKIGRPGYKVTKVRDPDSRQIGLLFQIQYPDIGTDIRPRHRFMSAFEQRVEPPNKSFQYLLIAAEPYETIAFKLQNRPIDRSTPGSMLWEYWDRDVKVYTLQIMFRSSPHYPAHPAAVTGANAVQRAENLPRSFAPAPSAF